MGIVCGRQAGLPVKNWRVLRISNIKVQKNVKEEAMSDDNESIRKRVAVKKRAVGSKFQLLFIVEARGTQQVDRGRSSKRINWIIRL